MILDIADFWADLGVTNCDFHLSDRRVMEQGGGGPLPPIQIGQRTWVGTVGIRRYPHADARAIKAKIEAMKEADGLFFVTPSDCQLGGGTGTVATIGADRREVTLSGLTATVGDYIGFTTGGIYSLHAVAKKTSATKYTVTPAVPLSIANGSAATTVRPRIKARLDVDMRGPAFAPVLSENFSLSFHQVLS